MVPDYKTRDNVKRVTQKTCMLCHRYELPHSLNISRGEIFTDFVALGLSAKMLALDLHTVRTETFVYLFINALQHKC